MEEIGSLYIQKELSVKKTLQFFSKIIPQLKFIKSIHKVYQDYDEPKFYQFLSQLQISPQQTDGYINSKRKAGGASFFSEEQAFLKCLGETIERYACIVYKRSDLIKGSYNKFKNHALNPNKIVSFSKEQKNKKIVGFNFSNETPFTWVWGKSLIDGEKKLIPTQLVYFSYRFNQKEGIIYLPISTGAAGGTCLASAIARGIMEIVERDAFIIHYLNKLPGIKIDLPSINNEKTKFLLAVCFRYRLEWHLVDISTDLGIPSFASIIIDKTRIGSAVSIGLKTHLNPIKAIIGSFEEAFHPRRWMRHVHEDEFKKYKNISPKNIISIKQRGMYWYGVEMIKHLNFWLKQKAKTLTFNNRYRNLTIDGQILKKLIVALKKKNYEAFYIDITPNETKNIPCKVVKVIIPQLQPLYLNENFPYFDGLRLYKVPKILGYNTKKSLNKIPHPFL